MSLAGKICGICCVQKASECLVVCQSIGGEEWSLVVFHKCATITFNIAIKGYYLLSFDIQNDVHCVSFVRISYGVEPRNTVKTINLWMFMMYDKSFFFLLFSLSLSGHIFCFFHSFLCICVLNSTTCSIFRYGNGMGRERESEEKSEQSKEQNWKFFLSSRLTSVPRKLNGNNIFRFVHSFTLLFGKWQCINRLEDV